jgi:hypothetical protein
MAAKNTKRSEKAKLAYSKTKTFYKTGSADDQARGRRQADKAKKRVSKK